MKTASCFLLLFTLVPAYQAVKCLCDNACLSGTGPEENCPDRLGAEHYASSASMIKAGLMIVLPFLFVIREGSRREADGNPLSAEETMKLMPNMTVEASEFLSDMTTKQLATFAESLQEVNSLAKENAGNEKWVREKYPKMLEDVFALTYVPKPLSHQFCLKAADDSGKIKRGCGAIFVAGLGGTAEVGCHDNPSYAQFKTGFKKYCRCDTNLCNSGDIEKDQPSASGNTTEASSALQMSSTRISTCLLLVVMVKTFVD